VNALSLTGVGIRALSVAFPPTVRTNDDVRARAPALTAAVEAKHAAQVWRQEGRGAADDPFSQAMAPYLSDPFRGTRERRVLAEGETFYPLILRAAREALDAAGWRGDQVGVLLSSGFVPQSLGVGDGAFLARDLGVRGPAWNYESACSGSVAGVQLAAALVSSGQFDSALVVVGCNYSQNISDEDTVGWTCGDGAAALLLTRDEPGRGVLGVHSITTSETCGQIWYDFATDRAPRPGSYLRLRAGIRSGKSLQDMSQTALRTCVDGALSSAGVRLEDVDFFVFNTPLAWYADFCARALGIPAEKTIDTYPLYANTGPVLMPTNLFHAARERRIRNGDLVLCFSIGSVSTAGAVVMRWGDVALGPAPTRA